MHFPEKETPLAAKFLGVIWLLFLNVLPIQTLFGQVTPEDKKDYLEALQDSQEALPEEISRRLIAVVPWDDPVNRRILHGDRLIWEGVPGQSRILVAAFMSRDSYDRYYKENLIQGKSEYLLTKCLWVTVVPELKNFFLSRNLPWYRRCASGAPSAKRIKQALGLHPAYNYEVLLELWTDPSNLFRPSPDPEITDHEATVAISSAPGSWSLPWVSNPFLKIDNTVLYKDSKYTSVVDTFHSWFVKRAETIYQIGDVDDPDTWGWPWTRLGYTYDWGNPRNHVGPSEFILRIDPNRNGGEVIVKLERAIDCDTPEWGKYFRVRQRGWYGEEASEYDPDEEDLESGSLPE